MSETSHLVRSTVVLDVIKKVSKMMFAVPPYRSL